MTGLEYDKIMAELDAEQRAIESRLQQIGEQKNNLVQWVIEHWPDETKKAKGEVA